MANNILIAESGSTKTDWILLSGKQKRRFQTQGLHPYLQTMEDIVAILERELKLNPRKYEIDKIEFYGAGINSSDSKKRIQKALNIFFPKVKVNTYSDLLASARATCGHNKGISCILGTGSNSCYYNGKSMGAKQPSLGYILGDEGSGNAIGKKVLQYYFNDLLDEGLKKKFELKYKPSLEVILNNIYRMPFPNRYLAEFAHFVMDNRGHYLIENIAEDCLNDFFINNLLFYKNIHKLPVHFTGSVAFHLKDILEQLCYQYEIELGKVVQRPIDNLVQFYV